MGCEGDCFGAPVAQSEKSTNAEPAEAGSVGAFRCCKAPVKILLWAGGMVNAIGVLVIRFLIDDQSVGTRGYEGLIRIGFQWAKLQ